jgi:hypothetical protein
VARERQIVWEMVACVVLVAHNVDMGLLIAAPLLHALAHEKSIILARITEMYLKSVAAVNIKAT